MPRNKSLPGRYNYTPPQCSRVNPVFLPPTAHLGLCAKPCRWGIVGEDTGGFAYWCSFCGAICDSGGKIERPTYNYHKVVT